MAVPNGYKKFAKQKAADRCKKCGTEGLWWYEDVSVTQPRARKWHLYDHDDNAHVCRPSTDYWIAKKDREFKRDLEKGRPIPPFKDIGREGSHTYYREAWTFMPQGDMPDDKVFVIERLRYAGASGKTHFAGDGVGKLEYRSPTTSVGRTELGRSDSTARSSQSMTSIRYSSALATMGQFAKAVSPHRLGRSIPLRFAKSVASS